MALSFPPLRPITIDQIREAIAPDLTEATNDAATKAANDVAPQITNAAQTAATTAANKAASDTAAAMQTATTQAVTKAANDAASKASADTAAAMQTATAQAVTKAANDAAAATATQVDTAATRAAQAASPKPATDLPPEAGTKGATGTKPEYARADHTHEVRARRKRVKLDSAGQFRWVFDKPFLTKPGVWGTWESETGKRFIVVYALADKFETQVINGVTWYTAVTVKGERYQPLPNMGLLTVLGSVVAALSNYDVFGGSAAGASVVLMAAEETPTA